MARRDIRAAVDIGSGTVRAVIAESRPGGVSLVGAGHCASAGLRKGVVIDIEAAGAAVANAVAMAESESGTAVSSVLVGVSGSHLCSAPSLGRTTVATSDREIAQEDVDRALESCRQAGAAPDREIVQIVPREFAIDGQAGIQRPVGMSGVILEVDAQVISGSSTALQNVRRAVSRANLEIDGMVLQSVACAEAVLSQEEAESGAIVLDIGLATTDIAVYRDGGLLHASLVPIGGGHITNDIALVLKVPVAYAEDLKLRYGAATADDVSPDDKCGGEAGVSRQILCQIIEARLDQLFDRVKRDLAEAGVDGQYAGGVVIVGGTAGLAGITDVVTKAFDMPARIGHALRVAGDEGITGAPAYAAALGLAVQACGDGTGQSGARGGRRRRGRKNSLTNSVIDWFREVFNS
ncbi:MAG: Cell division protein FtsA [Firmicutes bacterium ADurb.Bin506]|nr:MAG: Cell division protein FtsA [Firmicutes bacterium ADurb.Bin506]